MVKEMKPHAVTPTFHVELALADNFLLVGSATCRNGIKIKLCLESKAESTEVWAVAKLSGTLTPNTPFTCRFVEPCDDETKFSPEKITYDEQEWNKLKRLPCHEGLPSFKNAASAISPLLDPLIGIDNLAQIHSVNEATILHAIRSRYHNHIIYTNVGNVVLAMNPFEEVPELYTQQMVKRYTTAENPMTLPPHVYQLCSLAYQNLVRNNKDQCMLITGESGAGKTETTKIILSYYANSNPLIHPAMQTDDSEFPCIVDKIMMANPILECFGNASTSRNANSSRFGKWISITFDEYNRVRGAQILSFMLEVPRVCHHLSTDRSYHIFYNVVENRLGDTTGNVEDYSYLRSPRANSRDAVIHHHQKLCFQDMFQTLLQSLKCFGFTMAEKNNLFNIIAAILHLGNIEFCQTSVNNTEGCAIKEDSVHAFNTFVDLLQINADSLAYCLQYKTIVSGRDSVKVPLTTLDAERVRDNLSKLIYRVLFQWLILRINQCLHSSTTIHRSLGILDIAGFENFSINSLEQLLINLSNERLQYSFNRDIISSEIQDYKAEGVNHVDIQFYNNFNIVELLEGKAGILDILDEELFVPKGSERNFLTKLNRRFCGHPCFIASRFSDDESFTVRHFADNVTYSITNWLDKNRLYPPNEVVQILQTADNFIVKDFVKLIENTKKNHTVGNKFLQQLRKLMETIEKTNPHYIRCIKPNMTHKAWSTHSVQIIRQLRCTGIIEAVKIRKCGFILRIPYNKFCQYYSILAQGSINFDRSGCESIMNALAQSHKFESKDIYYGYTKFLAKDYIRCLLESAVSKSIDKLKQPLNVFIEAYETAIQEQKGMFLYPNPLLGPDVATPEALEAKLTVLSDNLNLLEKRLGELSYGPAWIQQAILAQKAMEREVHVTKELNLALDMVGPSLCTPAVVQQLLNVKNFAEKNEVYCDPLENIKTILKHIREEQEWEAKLEQPTTNRMVLLEEISRSRHVFFTPSFDRKLRSLKEKIAVADTQVERKSVSTNLHLRKSVSLPYSKVPITYKALSGHPGRPRKAFSRYSRKNSAGRADSMISSTPESTSDITVQRELESVADHMEFHSSNIFPDPPVARQGSQESECKGFLARLQALFLFASFSRRKDSLKSLPSRKTEIAKSISKRKSPLKPTHLENVPLFKSSASSSFHGRIHDR